MSSPYTSITLEDLQTTNKALVNCGANINEINSVRKHLESLKGGGLLQKAIPARVHALILSDVMGDDLSVIASGPTVPDASTFTDAWRVVEDYDLVQKLPQSVLKHLQEGLQGKQPETLKTKDISNAEVTTEILAGNQTALASALAEASRQGVNAVAAGDDLKGEARQACQQFFVEARLALEKVKQPALFAKGGETTVTIKGKGLGGRNLEFALAAVEPMQEFPGAVFFTLATDGEDGPTDAAGAVVTAETYKKAQAKHLDPHDFLENNDAYHFFEQVGGLIKTGSTGTNVNDLAVLIIN
ncbi:D-glycerate 2-kinase [bioreactor metagenome]|uniref:D-glycerate 2-kinase n=1 Tax=bioreactor metagenome TaxID=1076179 RepID=A0A645EBF1_9ZZZZ